MFIATMSSLDAERAKVLLSTAPSLLVHSGNVASWNKLRKKGVLTSTDEVGEGWVAAWAALLTPSVCMCLQLTSTIGASFTSWLGRQREVSCISDGIPARCFPWSYETAMPPATLLYSGDGVRGVKWAW